jgi:hypothetical protein
VGPNPKYAPLLKSQYTPQRFWDCAPLEQLEAWVRANVPAEMSANIARGMDQARFSKSEKEALAPAANAYLESRARRTAGSAGAASAAASAAPP